VMVRSGHFPRLRAAILPRIIPARNVMNVETPINSMVHKMALPITSMTGRSCWYDTPS